MLGETTTVALIKEFTAGGVIPRGSIVKRGSADDAVVVATASSEDYVGVAMNTAASGAIVRVMMANGIAPLVVGTAGLTQGGWVTADTGGVGVAPGTSAGTNYSVIGKAMSTSNANDIGSVFVCPGRIQG